MAIPLGYEKAMGIKQDDWITATNDAGRVIWVKPIGGAQAPAPASPTPTVPTPTPTTPSGAFESPGPLDLMGGAELQLELLDRRIAFDKWMGEQNLALQSQIANSQQAIAEAQMRLSAANSAADRASNEQMASANRALQAQLSADQITSNEYMQGRDLAQREAEFTRDLQFRQGQLSWQKVVDKATIEIEQARTELLYLADAREERVLQAQLKASPGDVVLYEYYKRGMEQPDIPEGSDPYYLGAMEAGGVDEFGIAQQVAEGPGPVAYSDPEMQALVQSITSGGDTLYNPNMGGVGAFGATVPSPNEISRSQFQGMDETDLGVLGSFLRAGVEVEPGGPRVGLDPADWLGQVKKSWVPTLSEGVGGPSMTVVS